MRIVVIGNGSTAVDGHYAHWVNSHTAKFLVSLADRGNRMTFVQPRSNWLLHGSTNDTVLPSEAVRSRVIDVRGRWTSGRDLLLMTTEIARADFVYAFYPGTLSRRLVWPLLLGRKPFGLYLRGEEFDEAGRDKRIIQGARFLASVSPTLSDRVKGLNPKVTTIRPMVDLDGSDALTRDFGPGLSKPVRLAYVGRLETAKGVRELLRAAHILAARNLPFELRIIGGGSLFSELKEGIPTELKDQVKLLGHISDRAALMRELEWSEIFIFPSHHEGFPRVLYEAMIKSNFIITTLVGGIAGTMKDGVNCMAVPVESPEAIADAVGAAVADPSFMQRISSAGLETVLEILANRPQHLDVFEQGVAGEPLLQSGVEAF